MSKRKPPVQIPHSVADEAAGTRASQRVAVGTDETHRKKRQALRAKLRKLGLPEEYIERRTDVMRARQQAERIGNDAEARRLGEVERELLHEQTYLTTRLDDSKHKPTYVDPVLRGAARATGNTATAVRTGKTFTKYQLDRRDQRGA